MYLYLAVQVSSAILLQYLILNPFHASKVTIVLTKPILWQPMIWPLQPFIATQLIRLNKELAPEVLLSLHKHCVRKVLSVQLAQKPLLSAQLALSAIKLDSL